MQMLPIGLATALTRNSKEILPFPTPKDEIVKLEWLESSEK